MSLRERVQRLELRSPPFEAALRTLRVHGVWPKDDRVSRDIVRLQRFVVAARLSNLGTPIGDIDAPGRRPSAEHLAASQAEAAQLHAQDDLLARCLSDVADVQAAARAEVAQQYVEQAASARAALQHSDDLFWAETPEDQQ